MNKLAIMASAANAGTFFQSMKVTALEWVNAGLDNFVIPIGVVCCGATFVFLLIKCVADYKEGHGEDMKAKAFPLLLCLIIAAILLTKNMWWAAFTG